MFGGDPPQLRFERTPAPRAGRWRRRPPGSESHDPLALLLGDDSGAHGHGDAAALVDFFLARPAPRAAVLFEQFFVFDGPPRAGRVIGKTPRGQTAPPIENALTHPPPSSNPPRPLQT